MGGEITPLVGYYIIVVEIKLPKSMGLSS